LTETMFGSTISPEEVAAVIVEPIQGEGGCVVPHPDFLTRLRELTTRHGILLIADEVQTAMGRTGRFFASERFDLNPDIIKLPKGIAAALPLGALLARESVMQWNDGGHGTTFGGNPLAAAAALATVNLLDGGLVANADRVGRYLIDKCRRRLGHYPSIGDIRGLGLMIGLEIVDVTDGMPAPSTRLRIIQEAFNRGLILIGCGKITIRLAPPLTVDEEDVDSAVDIRDDVMRMSDREKTGSLLNGALRFADVNARPVS